MSWEAISAVAETFGVIALVVSIIYVGLEMRLSRIWSRKQAFEGYLALIFGWFAKISTDSDTARLYNAGRDSFDSLNEEEQTRFSYLMIEKFACLELLREYDKDKLGKEESVNRIPVWIKEDFSYPGVRQWWDKFGSHSMAEDFVDYVNEVSKK